MFERMKENGLVQKPTGISKISVNVVLVPSLQQSILGKRVLVSVAISQCHLLEKRRPEWEIMQSQVQNRRLKNKAKTEGFWIEERHWPCHWAISPEVFNCSLGRSSRPKRGGVTTLVRATPLVKVFVAFPLSSTATSNHFPATTSEKSVQRDGYSVAMR